MDGCNRYSAVLMEMMVDRLQIAAVAAHERSVGAGVKPLEATCRSCPIPDRCEAWLVQDNAADALGYRAFCPNAAAFDRWRSASLPEGR